MFREIYLEDINLQLIEAAWWAPWRGNRHLCTSEPLTMTFVAECATLLLLVKSCQTGNRFLRQRGPCEFKLLFSNVLTRCTIGTDLQEIFNWNRKPLAPRALFYTVCSLLLKRLWCVSTTHSFLYLLVRDETKTYSKGAAEAQRSLHGARKRKGEKKRHVRTTVRKEKGGD